ncbi:IS3 family transposase [Bacillus sp. DX1.1]|uniref:IS3 family transposase n=1 Tax=Bacillus sp. DX1.1 TaxID=3055866 RepID=UPI00338EE4B1
MPIYISCLLSCASTTRCHRQPLSQRKLPYNACIESFFSHFKSEMFNLNSYQNEKELIQTIETYIYHYNYKRFQKDSTIELQLNIEFRWRHSLFYSCLLDGGKTNQSVQNQKEFIHQVFGLIA